MCRSGFDSGPKYKIQVINCGSHEKEFGNKWTFGMDFGHTINDQHQDHYLNKTRPVPCQRWDILSVLVQRLSQQIQEAAPLLKKTNSVCATCKHINERDMSSLACIANGVHLCKTMQSPHRCFSGQINCITVYLFSCICCMGNCDLHLCFDIKCV